MSILGGTELGHELRVAVDVLNFLIDLTGELDLLILHLGVLFLSGDRDWNISVYAC